MKSLLAAHEGNVSFTNPYFHADVVNRLSEILEKEMIAKLGNPGNAMLIAEDILTMNSDYPCNGKRIFECPIFMRNPRKSHLNAYRGYVDSAFSINDGPAAQNAVGLVQEFIERFYPGSGFVNDDFAGLNFSNPAADNYVPLLALKAGAYLYHRDLSLARKFFRAASSIACNRDAKEPSYKECDYAKRQAEFLLEFSDEKNSLR